MKIIAVGGVPGTGKTTIIEKIIDRIEDWEVAKPAELLDSIFSPALNLYVLGKYQPWYDGEGYAQGTDRLSMAVQPKAIEFLKTCKSNILFEGDRLFTQGFLEACSAFGDLSIFLLQSNQETLQERYDERGSEQSEQFIRSRATKYNNLGTNFELMPLIEDYPNNNLEEQKIILDKIAEML
jgi:guanylate kinase